MQRPGEPYRVTLERGRDGTYLAWVDALPGLAVRGRTRSEVLERAPEAILSFLSWAGADEATDVPEVTLGSEVEAAIVAEEDTEVLLDVDRAPLTLDDWRELASLLERSRAELLSRLETLPDDLLDARRGARTIRLEIEHIGFVELMYAAWTFDLRSRRGLSEFLAWTREVAQQRLEALATGERDDLTEAHWSGAPEAEAWTPRKAARRLVWHELLHLRAIEDVAVRSSTDS